MTTTKSENSALETENRILRKILEGIDMVYGEEQPLSDRQAPAPPEEQKSELPPLIWTTEDSAKNMKLLLAINKIDLLSDRILYIYADSPYCRVFFDVDQELSLDLRIPIQILEMHFQNETFLRIHRSYLAHPNRVLCADRKGVRDYELWMKDSAGKTINLPIGRSYLVKLREGFPQWFKD